MAKDKDRTLNPAAAHLKSEKNKALKKSKAQQSAQRNEKLARRNPERLQRQIDELKETREAQGGQLRPRDQQALEQLERDVKLIRKAREATGAGGAAPEQHHERRRDGGDRGGRGRGGAMSSSLGKRRRDGEQDRDDFGYQSDETDPDVRSIPMPRDTPPPVPPRPRRQHQNGGHDKNAAQRTPHALPAKPVSQTTYSSAPQMRDLQKEATTKFVPAAVAARLKQKQGMTGGAGGGGDGGRLLEPEEVDALERGGYLAAKGAADEAAKEEAFAEMSKDGAPGGDAGTLDEEEAAFERELRAVDEAEDDGNGDSIDDEDNDQRDADRALLEEAGKRDAEKAAQAAADEEAHDMMAQEAAANAKPRARHVEMEEVEDEDL